MSKEYKFSEELINIMERFHLLKNNIIGFKFRMFLGTRKFNPTNVTGLHNFSTMFDPHWKWVGLLSDYNSVYSDSVYSEEEAKEKLKLKFIETLKEIDNQSITGVTSPIVVGVIHFDNGYTIIREHVDLSYLKPSPITLNWKVVKEFIIPTEQNFDDTYVTNREGLLQERVVNFKN